MLPNVDFWEACFSYAVDLMKNIGAGIERGKRTNVFGRDDSGFYGWAKCKTRLDEKLGDASHWVVHDLRRTAVTGMAELPQKLRQFSKIHRDPPRLIAHERVH